MLGLPEELRRRYEQLWQAPPAEAAEPVRRIPRGLLPFLPIAAAVVVLVLAIASHDQRRHRPMHPARPAAAACRADRLPTTGADRCRRAASRVP